jgi:hypothetical protein
VRRFAATENSCGSRSSDHQKSGVKIMSCQLT